MKLNNKGFAVSTIMYMVLVVAVLVMALTLALLNGRKLIIDKQKQIAFTNVYDNMSTVDPFPIVFSVTGPCKFNGYSGNITGSACQEYSDRAYIDTGVQLFNSTNWEKDFEISFKVSDYSPSNQIEDTTISDGQLNTIMNVKFEDSTAKYPGFVLRRDTSSSNLQISSRNNDNIVTESVTYSNNIAIRFVRKNKKVYYSINNGAFMFLQDFTNLYRQFDTTVWFGGTNINGEPHRLADCTISDMQIRMGKMKDSYVTLP